MRPENCSLPFFSNPEITAFRKRFMGFGLGLMTLGGIIGGIALAIHGNKASEELGGGIAAALLILGAIASVSALCTPNTVSPNDNGYASLAALP
ncbi:MAG: hypothetical protein K0R66_785 [Gammaproteobacteria bacterium]|jgi:hypothetical protein|nr:hypothetical protein [Gammaproteobacteria bacterium]